MATRVIINMFVMAALLSSSASVGSQQIKDSNSSQANALARPSHSKKYESNTYTYGIRNFLNETTSFKWTKNFTHKCKLRATDKHMQHTIVTLLERQAKLIEYHFTVKNHSVNPLLVNAKWTYKLATWTRVSHGHGQTMLSLAFNYGVLSLMTLSFGVATVAVELYEEPYGCLLGLTEAEKVTALLEPLLKDLNDGRHFIINEGEAICHQMIINKGGYAKFTDQCCFIDRKTGTIHCLVDYPNMWLHVLEWLMASITLVVILFGPLACPSFFSGAGLDTIRYVVKLKEPLFKFMCVFRSDDGNNTDVMTDHHIDLRDEKGFHCTKAAAKHAPSDMIIPIKISEYNIWVNYEKLLPENSVPVGFWACLIRAIFLCKLQNIMAFQDCCEANSCGCLRETKPVPWISICRVIGRVLMVLFMPFPFYFRLIMYVMFEQPEIQDRYLAAEKAQLPMWFEYRILQYLTPTHPLFITAYAVYYVAGITLAYFSTTKDKSRFQEIIINSFRDLNDMSWLGAMGMVARNVLWPFRKMGIFGIFVGIIYWPVIVPISLIVCVFYCLPLVFLTWRMIFHSLGISSREKAGLEQTLPGQLRDDTTGMNMFEAERLMNTISSQETGHNLRRYFKHCYVKATLWNLGLAVISIITFYAVMLMISECASFVLHICVFTMMGIIVNASKVLKYGALIFMVILYSYDCYNNVYLQYLKLNKALFSEIKGRIKDISEVTMLPSYLQENRGFKSQENSDQADHETADDLLRDSPKNWIINDLILFIDNNDVPRIPRKLFEQVCDIEVPGSPGPVYRSLLVATGKFFLIILFLIFVFIVVLSFGDVYKISSTNQMLATMAGGFMPFIFSNLLKPAQPAIELGSVSFKSKLEEIVINFWQLWPMYDFKFEIEEEQEEEEDAEAEEADDGKKDKGDSKFKPEKKENTKSRKKKRDECYEKKMSVAEMLDSSYDVKSTLEEVMERLQQTRSYRSAEGQLADIVLWLPPPETSSDNLNVWGVGSDHDNIRFPSHSGEREDKILNTTTSESIV